MFADVEGHLKLKHNLEMTHSLKTMEEKNRQQRSNIWKLSMTPGSKVPEKLDICQ